MDNVTGDGTAAAADFTALQLGLYAQDEFQMSDRLKLTYGLRIDVPLYIEDLIENSDFNTNTIPLIEAQGYDMQESQSGQMPSAQIMLSPRIGFNWDVNGDKMTQLRGGIGIFTSRIPFVWPGASYNNNGLMVGNAFATNVAFRPDWDNQYRSTDFNPSARVISFS